MWAPAFPGRAVRGLYFRVHGGDTRSVLGWAWTARLGGCSSSWLFSTRPDMTPLLHCSFSIRDRFTNSEILTSPPQTLCHLASEGLAQFKKIKYAITWMQECTHWLQILQEKTQPERSVEGVSPNTGPGNPGSTYSECGCHKGQILAFPGAVGARSVELKHGNPVFSVYLE